MQALPAKTVFRGAERQGEVLDSLVCNGCIISGARVEHSILGPRMFVHSWAHVEIVWCLTMSKAVIGYDLDHDRQRFTVTDNGIVVIPKGTVLNEG